MSSFLVYVCIIRDFDQFVNNLFFVGLFVVFPRPGRHSCWPVDNMWIKRKPYNLTGHRASSQHTQQVSVILPDQLVPRPEAQPLPPAEWSLIQLVLRGSTTLCSIPGSATPRPPDPVADQCIYTTSLRFTLYTLYTMVGPVWFEHTTNGLWVHCSNRMS